jgi:hypothetical protein
MILKKYLYNRKIRKLISEASSREHRFCPLEEANSVLALFLREDYDEVAPRLKELYSQNKQVYCCVSGNGSFERINELPCIYIDKTKDVDKYGIPIDEIQTKFMNSPADILFDLSRGKCRTLKLLLVQHPSTFKVGERLNEDFMYDFSMIMTEGRATSDLFENLLFYLRSIRSK